MIPCESWRISSDFPWDALSVASRVSRDRGGLDLLQYSVRKPTERIRFGAVFGKSFFMGNTRWAPENQS